MRRVLLVVRPFGPHVTGDLICGDEEMHDVLTGPHAHDVIRTAAPMPAADKQEES